ncbi:NucA/NucB deoxyribonuclease domain-containing protein [Spongiactinospora gelatinilytica]|uniref:NucA/NucB deoxyribonuclease domain-containing protein n=1 Tax=Spongiactinospora gelatinilytica TaxID=2666298 RepID=UPI001314D07E
MQNQASPCLHRTRDATTIENNRKKSIAQCRKLKPGYKKPDSCDEFPFASTREGAASTVSNYSVKIIKDRDNCSSGARTSVFYQRNRILDRYPFWVDVIRKGTRHPVSGAPGVILIDPLPDEVVDLDGCSIDGVD